MKQIVFASLILISACSHKTQDKASLPKTLDEAVANTARTPENKARDMYRHPAETLAFFGIKPDMTVVEISPGAGWYLEILAPYLSEKGKYIMANPTPQESRPYMAANEQKIKNWADENSHVNIHKVTFDLPHKTELAPANSVDAVVTFRNVHNWVSMKAEKEAFKAFYKALKPGGVLGVVEHRELPNKKDPLVKSGYVREQDVINMAKAAGFRLVAKSEVNANPKDTKNHPAGVWTLPPSLRLGEKDRAKYVSIGESDRMTLKFVKPKK